MKRTVFAIIVLYCTCSPCFSQEKKWTFQECVAYALEHNMDICSKKIEIKSAELTVKASRQSRLPNLDLGITQNFQFGKVLTEENGYQRNNQSNTNVVIETEFLLFSGFQLKRQIAIDRLNLDISFSCLEKAEKDVTLHIALQFLQILFYKELEKINQEQIELTKRELANTENLTKLGRIPQSYIYDVQAQLASDELVLTLSSVKEKEYLLLLSQLLDLKKFQEFDIEIPVLQDIEDLFLSLSQVDFIYALALDFFPEIKIATQLLEVSKKNYFFLNQRIILPSQCMPIITTDIIIFIILKTSD